MNRKTLIQTLEAVLPSGRVVSDESTYGPYSKDYSSEKSANPTIVVKPQTHDEVGQILAFANQHNIPVTPRGTGTGKSGGSIPIQAGIVMAMDTFNTILEIDEANRMVVLQPGVICEDIYKAVEKKGLSFPVEPSSAHMCTIGGMVSENAGGFKAIKYGVTGNYVVGLSGFYASGEPFKWGGKLVKNVAGYDLISLVVGSEGTLVVITELILKLITKPKESCLVWAAFDSVHEATQAVQRFGSLGINPSATEFMDKTCINAYEYAHKTTVDGSKKEGHVLIQIEGNQSEVLKKEAEQVSRHLKNNGASFIKIATQKKEKEALTHIRMKISESLSAISTHKESIDITVPPAQMAAYMTFLIELNKKSSFTLLGYGHLGDGNFHVNILNKDKTEKEWIKGRHDLEQQLINKALEVGGTLTGEHGIGLSKKKYMPQQFSQKDMDVFKSIKQVFDPNGILNPGKII